MEKRFHVFVRHHANDHFTVWALTEPKYAAYGASAKSAQDELREVLSDQLASRELNRDRDYYLDGLERTSVELELRAVQQNRLLRVPMRFTVLYRELPEHDVWEVRLPRLNEVFRIIGRENIDAWSQEIIRNRFHLKSVEQLVQFQYDRGERIDVLAVNYHGSGSKKAQLRRDAIHKRHRGPSEGTPPSQLGVLDRVGYNLVADAKNGELSLPMFRDAEIRRLTEVLSSARRQSVVLIGQSGVGKTALVHGLCHRIMRGQVPDGLAGARVIYLPANRIMAGMRYLGQWQGRCENIVSAARAEGAVLFMDNLLEMVSAGRKKAGLTMGRLLLPYVAAGEVSLVFEVTPDALAMAEQLDSGLVNALRRIHLSALSGRQAFEVLEAKARRLSKMHNVTIPEPTVARALDVLARFGDVAGLPGSGLNLMERIARRRPDGHEQEASRRSPVVLAPVAAIEAFAEMSGFPLALVDPERQLDPTGVRAHFRRHIIGQSEATRRLADLVVLLKAGLNDPNRPIGSFLFMGPTGVGKTESALTLADYLFGDRDRLIRMDMSEYAYPGAALRLAGGVDGQGDLTRQVRKQPFSLVLLDEIEKADTSVYDLLLQVLGEGRLTDAAGATVSFEHTIIIMTSNLGASRTRPIGLRDRVATGRRQHFASAATDFFRPEFMNRIDFVVPFEDLERDHLRSIAKRMLDDALEREGLKRRQLRFEYHPELVDRLAERGYDPKYGARPLKRTIETCVLVPLSRLLVEQKVRPGCSIEIGWKENAVTFGVRSTEPT